jgi:hypothetical protein
MKYLPINKYLITITPIFLYIFLIINGIIGINFGHHWDEHIFIRQACDSLESGSFLPHKYIYPSLCYYIVLAVAFLYKNLLGIDNVQSLLSDNNFMIWVRCVFLFISSLTVVWVYLLTFKITRKYFVALIAGLIFCTSFEFSYHSRWAVSDCIAVQFAFLSTFILFLDRNVSRKIVVSSFIAGIAAGTKYTAAIVCINILIYIVTEYFAQGENAKLMFKNVVLFCLFSVLGFLITTPGSIFEFQNFIGDVLWQKNVYSSGHFGYTVDPGFTHFTKIFEYLAFNLFSKYTFGSLVILIFSLMGALYAFKIKYYNALGLFLVMIIYILYVSSYKVMIVRNLLYILPYFTVLAAIGFKSLMDAIPSKFIKQVVVTVVVVCLLYTGQSVVKASVSIRNNNQNDFTVKLKEYIKQNPHCKFIFSEKVLSLPGITNSSVIPLSGKTYLVFFLNEVPWQVFEANINGQFEGVIGIDDVNLNYYPTWSGKDRLVVVDFYKASDFIKSYVLPRKKYAIKTETICNAESVAPQRNTFFSSLWVNDSVLSAKMDSPAILGADDVSTDFSHSGKYSTYHFESRIKIDQGLRYVFTVWRKSQRHRGMLAIYNRVPKFWLKSSEIINRDTAGWEEIQLEYFAYNKAIKEIVVKTEQSDDSEYILYDDFTITKYERPL